MKFLSLPSLRSLCQSWRLMKRNDCARKKWRASEVRADIQVYLDGDDTPRRVPFVTARSSTKRTSGFTSSVRSLQPAVCGLTSIYEPSSSGSDTPDMESTMRYLKPS